ncbi:mitochondrial ribosomal protein L28-domain-containing protein [Umbelopsis sp. PMI_123]|nr:mitochondrial ribosomal protein L28-domain-containing protein [Umbelopsis sp. PMI_123]
MSLFVRTGRLSLSRQQLRRVAAPAPATGGSGDQRLEIIRRVLFEQPVRELPKLEGEELQQHETIERAWKLHQNQERERRNRELEKKFRKMHAAMNELEKTSDRLFKAAIVKSRHITFPREMKIPTETPSPQGWNHEYKPPVEVAPAKRS